MWGARPVLPSPSLFYLQIAATPEEAQNGLLKSQSEFDKLLFREDSFDPVSKMRRGRIYKPGTSQPSQCRVLPFTIAEYDEARNNKGVVTKSLFSYQSYRLPQWSPSLELFAAVGSDTAHSMWRIVSNDCMCLNEELLTMRPLYFLGTLPDLLQDEIPEEWRSKVIDSVKKVADSMYKANADSIVELCRHAASATLFATFHERIPQAQKKDLRNLANIAEQEKRRIIAHCGKTIADLHSRLKPNNQEHYGFRSVSERDAELAVHCLSFILIDLGYART